MVFVFSKQAILDKVQQLWEERDMLTYTQALGVSVHDRTSIQQITTMLQYHIFDFDQLCENDQLPLSELYAQAEVTKQDVFALTQIVVWSDEAQILTQRLFDFYEIELGMRKQTSWEKADRTPLDYTLHDFYRIKSCDIYLQRKLICHLAQQPNCYSDAVELFDCLGEVLDDLLDVQEDQEQINANRFLISLVSRGSQATVEEYQAFVQTQLGNIVSQQSELQALWLQVDVLSQQLVTLLEKDRSGVTKSKTNELLFG